MTAPLFFFSPQFNSGTVIHGNQLFGRTRGQKKKKGMLGAIGIKNCARNGNDPIHPASAYSQESASARVLVMYIHVQYGSHST